MQTAPVQVFAERAPIFKYQSSMKNKGPNSVAYDAFAYLHVVRDTYNVLVVILSTKIKTFGAFQTLFEDW